MEDPYRPLIRDEDDARSPSAVASSLAEVVRTPVQPSQAQVQVPMVNMGGPMVPVVVPVGPEPMRIRCYHCGAYIKTSTTTVHKDSAHICCLLTGLSTCCLCFWIPFCCCDSFQKTDHRCPCCGSYLGTYNG